MDGSMLSARSTAVPITASERSGASSAGTVTGKALLIELRPSSKLTETLRKYRY